MKSRNKHKISLEVVLIEDKKIGGYSGYFKQFPNVFSEGETQEELINNLFNALHDIFEYEASKSGKNLKDTDTNVIERSIYLQSA